MEYSAYTEDSVCLSMDPYPSLLSGKIAYIFLFKDWLLSFDSSCEAGVFVCPPIPHKYACLIDRIKIKK